MNLKSGRGPIRLIFVQRVQNLISIGTPLDKYDFSFLQRCRKPILFVHGARDEFGNVDKLRSLVTELGTQTTVKLVVIPGADHFFANQLDDLKRVITDWTRTQLSSLH